MSPPLLLLAAVIEVVGAIVQGSLGFGLNIVAGPLLVLVDPQFAPAPILLAASFGAALVSLHERGTVHWPAVWSGISGQIPGALVGLLVATTFPSRTLQAVLGAIVLSSVGLSLVHHRIAARWYLWVPAGAMSGLYGTVAGVGGAPFGLACQQLPGAVLRPTVSMFSFLSAVFSFAVLAVGGTVHERQLLLAGVLAPSVITGFLVSRLLIRHMRAQWIRYCVVALVASSATAVIVQAFVH
jgi:uncharacterized membrane protein YfcA